MTTLAVPAYNGPLAGGDEQAACRQDAAQVVGAAVSTQVAMLADGLLLMVATLISRLVNRVSERLFTLPTPWIARTITTRAAVAASKATSTRWAALKALNQRLPPTTGGRP